MKKLLHLLISFIFTGSLLAQIGDNHNTNFTGIDDGQAICLPSGTILLTAEDYLGGGTFYGEGVIDNGDGTADFIPSGLGPGAYPIAFSRVIITPVLASPGETISTTFTTTKYVTVVNLRIYFDRVNKVSQPGAMDGGIVTETVGSAVPHDSSALYRYNNYLWSNGGTERYLYSLDTGLYRLTVTDPNGCVRSDSIFVPFGNADADFSGIMDGQDIDVCANGDNILLTATNSGGTFGGDGVIDNGDGTANFSPAGAGTGSHIITCTINSVPPLFRQIAIGRNMKIAIANDGTLWGWGDVRNLGVGPPAKIRFQDRPVQIGTDTHWLSVSCGADHTLAIKSDGTLWGWGVNSQGQLGDGTNIGKFVPTQIGSDNDWASVDAGLSTSIAVKDNGTLWSWGGATAFNPGTIINNPRQISPETNWVEVNMVENDAVALNSNGELYKVLTNYDPVRLNILTGTGGSSWKSGSMGNAHYLAIKNDGTLWSGGTWGSNTYGELGYGYADGVQAFAQVGTDNDWASVTAAFHVSYGIKTDGSLWAWGKNEFRQLADGTTKDKYSPTKVGTDNDWESINAFENGAIAKKTDGSHWQWGLTYYGNVDGSYGGRNPFKLEFEDIMLTKTANVTGISASFEVTNVSQFDASDGGAKVEAAGGTAPYSYLWSNGSAVDSVTGVTAGMYYLTITDVAGCTDMDSVLIIVNTTVLMHNGTGTATMNGSNDWVHLYDPDGKIIASINGHGQNLGEVTGRLFYNGGNPFMVNTPGLGCGTQAVMNRSFVIKSTIAPTLPVSVRLYFTDHELASLIDSSLQSFETTEIEELQLDWPWNDPEGCMDDDDVRNINELFITQITGLSPTEENGVFNPNIGRFILHETENSGIGNHLFDANYIEFMVEGFSEFWIHGSTNYRPLPVELTSFTVQANPDQFVQIKWETATEVNNKGFEILRSKDGLHFEQIAFAEGHGNSTANHQYSYLDSGVKAGTYYYRLGQIDYDGGSKLSEIRSVSIYAKVLDAIGNFVPNPATNSSKIQLNLATGSNVLLQLYDITGKQLLTKKIKANTGKNEIYFDVRGLGAGMYIVKIIVGDKLYTKRLMVNK